MRTNTGLRAHRGTQNTQKEYFVKLKHFKNRHCGGTSLNGNFLWSARQIISTIIKNI